MLFILYDSVGKKKLLLLSVEVTMLLASITLIMLMGKPSQFYTFTTWS